MKIVVNHLTRMQPGYVCVAGIDLKTGKHVRPVQGGTRLTTKVLASEGGAFEIAGIVDLGSVKPCGRPPEMEDISFLPSQSQLEARCTDDGFWGVLMTAAKPNLNAIFGPDLKPSGASSMAVDIGCGATSLGCLAPEEPPSVDVDGFGKVKIRLNDNGKELYLSVTDLRLYEGDQKTPRVDVISELDGRFQDGEDVILSLGLARAWMKPGDSQARHFLQVNNIHLRGDPTWQGG